MKSIKTKISVLVLLCVVVSVVLIGNVSIRSSKKVVEENSEQILSLLCSNKTETLNALLSRIEQSVVTLWEYTSDQIEDLARFKTDREYVRELSGRLENIAVNAADNTEGAMSVYVRYNPEFTEPSSGVFYSRESEESDLIKLTPTDFSMYDPSDTAHVGWYYIPVNNGKATWMDPYVNENLNIKMISYVIPIRIEGESVGIVGMDINFQVIEDIINPIRIYDSGYAFLTDAKGNTVLHRDFDMNEAIAHKDGLSGLAEELTQDSAAGKLYSYTYGGESKRLVFSVLNNGMRLAVTAPAMEIYKEASRLTGRIIMIALAALLVSLVISLLVLQGVVKPLKELNRAAGKIADGELNVSITCHSRDEVGTLADSFRRTAERLHAYIANINEVASVLGQIGEGNLTVGLTQQYDGEFARLRDALQRIKDTLNHDIYQIKMASGEVSDGAGQVSDGAQVLSRGASEQTASIEELSGVMEDLLRYARENQENAQTANRLTTEAGEGLGEASRRMEFMLGAMNRISSNAEKITQIIKTINDIALQTNILAINAAIEAARAGEAGKGFSIVAGQVKALADKSVKASANIEELVSNTVKSIEEGGGIAADTGKYIQEAVSGAERVTRIVSRIVSSSGEQVGLVSRVENGVEQISNVTQQNSATSQEEAAASEELSAQSQMLKELVAKFRLEYTESDGRN